jgi:hypothetical protein
MHLYDQRDLKNLVRPDPIESHSPMGFGESYLRMAEKDDSVKAEEEKD